MLGVASFHRIEDSPLTLQEKIVLNHNRKLEVVQPQRIKVHHNGNKNGDANNCLKKIQLKKIYNTMNNKNLKSNFKPKLALVIINNQLL